MTGSDNPRQLLQIALDQLALLDSASGQAQRERIDALLGPDAAWENPMAMMDPAQSVGLTPQATSLRIETEELISELWVRRCELTAKSDPSRYAEAVHCASLARWLLNYHAAVARQSSPAALLGMRDAAMADNLAYVLSRERGRGKVLAFAHNSHLRRGKAEWQWGPDLYAWFPAGAHLDTLLGARYGVIGTGVGVSDANGIGQPEAGTLEARLTAAPGPARFIPTYKGQGLPADAIAALPLRSGSVKNLTYFALSAASLTDFDGLAVLDATGYSRGGPPLQQ
jgi:erythromycin esterase-like protein